MPAISVLMPVYNAEKYVGEAVESILNQTFRDFEFITIDDGSTDHSLEILRRYKKQDSRIRLISRPNTGYVVALNEMLALARGELIARMDADDVSMRDRFSLQVAFLREHPRVAAVGGQLILIDAEGRLLRHCPQRTTHAAIDAAHIEGHTSLCHPATMFRRSAVLDAGAYRAEFMPAEDLDLWLRLGDTWELENVLQTVLSYRQHSASVSERNIDQQIAKSRCACEEAWKRRGIQGTFTVKGPWRARSDRNARHGFLVMYGGWALESKQYMTASLYGVRAIRCCPWRRSGWRMMARGVVAYALTVISGKRSRSSPACTREVLRN